MSTQTLSNVLTVGPSPHILETDTTAKIMWSVAAALLPAVVVAWANFGWYAVAVVFVSIAAAVMTEAVIQRLRGIPVTVKDGSAFVTGLLLAMTLPPNVPLYLPLIGSVFAIGIAKQAFGGLGCNIWNPALAARAFLLAAYSGMIVMSEWPIVGSKFFGNIVTDAVTKATPCAVLKSVPLSFFSHYSLWELANGFIPGSIGETSAIALIAGGIFLVWRGAVNWHLPASYILTLMLFVVLMPMRNGQGGWTGVWSGSVDPVFLIKFMFAHALSGGLLPGAFFMATDMVTSPLTSKGQIIFGAGCGVLTGIIRIWGGYPEGVCYAILIMNTVVWLIDKMAHPKQFGSN